MVGKYNFKRKGYTLIEVVLVMVLFAIMITGIVVGYNTIIDKGRDSGVDINLKSINTSIDYLKEKNGTLPNIAILQNELGMESYKFILDRALISEIDGELLITIRAQTTELSKYNIPYALNIIAIYDGSLGTYVDGDMVDVSTYDIELKSYDVEQIRMLVLDNTPSGVPEIIWLN